MLSFRRTPGQPREVAIVLADIALVKQDATQAADALVEFMVELYESLLSEERYTDADDIQRVLEKQAIVLTHGPGGVTWAYRESTT